MRDKVAETEKITLNLGFVDLGRIDLLVKEGFYSNRTDLIRTAIRNQLGQHATDTMRSVERHSLEIGLHDFTRDKLEAAQAAGEQLHVRVLGLARFGHDVTPDLVRATIASLTVLGSVQASAEIKAVLADRME